MKDLSKCKCEKKNVPEYLKAINLTLSLQVSILHVKPAMSPFLAYQTFFNQRHNHSSVYPLSVFK